ncbi:MAG: hypothetical protein H6832_16090 [Planctomycetes bacterium]|nr:hypothetical protein [Planctomycetota bacterium]
MKRSLLAFALLATPVFAQSTTIPIGFDTVQGGQSFFHWGSVAGRTMQVADRSNPRPRPISELSFRRRSNATSTGSGTLDAEVIMSQCPIGFLDTHFDSNERINRKVVLKSQVNIPDWSTAVANPPFDFTFKFSSTWVYTGQEALIWTIRYQNSTDSGKSMDRAFGAIRVTSTSSSIGTGCGSSAETTEIQNSGNYANEVGMHLLCGATGLPANTPTWLLIDSTAANLTIPGLCTKLQALPNIMLPFGSADGTGVLTKKYLTFPYIASLVSGTLVTQILYIDPAQTGLPLGLTGGTQGTMPASSNVTGTATAYGWASGFSATTVTGDFFFFTGAPVAEAK